MILKDQRIFVAGVEISGDTNNVALETSVDIKDRTAFGDSSRVKRPGLRASTVGMSGYFEATDDAIKEGLFAVSNAPIVIAASGLAHGALAYFFSAVHGEYGINAAVGDLLQTTLSAQSNGALVRGVVALNEEGLASSMAADALNLGPVAAGKKLVACVSVLANDDPADSVQVVIESDAADDFNGDETARITFDAKNEVGAQIIEIDGPVTDTWYRATCDVVGASPNINVLVTIGIV